MSRSAEDIMTDLMDLTQFISEAETQTRAMQEVDLDDLDLKVAGLCEEVQALPADQTAAVQQPMMDMISGLESLAEALKEAQEKSEG